MALFRPSAMYARAQRATSFRRESGDLLLEHVRAQAKVDVHDIFMSHAFDDKDLVLGVTKTIEDMGYSVYLDWRDDPLLDRRNITPATAAQLRARMKSSKCLFFATTQHASTSRWMPWELGYKDGHNTRTAILPFSETETTAFQGQEYLGIYPYVDEAPEANTGIRRLWVRRSPTMYVIFDAWLTGAEPRQR
jgi:hypothetical protein